MWLTCLLQCYMAVLNGLLLASNASSIPPGTRKQAHAMALNLPAQVAAAVLQSSATGAAFSAPGPYVGLSAARGEYSSLMFPGFRVLDVRISQRMPHRRLNCVSGSLNLRKCDWVLAGSAYSTVHQCISVSVYTAP